jgi:hypothetical protein
MNNPLPSASSTPARLEPEARADFNPAWLPLANGSPAPPPSADPRNLEIVRQFQTAYYEINASWAALRELRARPDSPEFPPHERTALQNIETALRQRDELENQCAPFGIIAEPLMEQGLTKDIRFTFGSVRADGRFRAQPFVSAALLNFRVPPKVPGRALRPPGPPPANATSIFPCAE